MWGRQQTGSSPHTRGALRAVHLPTRAPGIIPAYAGSTLRQQHLPSPSGGSSPHTRGARIVKNGTFSTGRIIPAYAGSTPTGGNPDAPCADHPRIRGEHISCSRFVPAIMGSSPHTRGAPVERAVIKSAFRIIPAYAGSTRFWCRRQPRGWDHPRIRGEHVYLDVLAAAVLGSSPHTRGARAAS